MNKKKLLGSFDKKIANIRVDSRELDLLILSISYASANRDDLCEAIDRDIYEFELTKLLEMLEALKKI